MIYIPDAKILVVDDDKVNLLVTQSVFSQFGARIDMAESGQLALRMVQSQRYDMVFMDQMMPEMSGKQTVKEIRSLSGDYFKNLPIYMLSAQEAGLEKEVEGLSVLGVLYKPLKPSALEKAFAELPKDLVFSTQEESRKLSEKGLTAFIKEGERALEELRQAAETGEPDVIVKVLSGLKETAIAANVGALVKMIREYEFKWMLGKKEEIQRNRKIVLRFLENQLELSKKSAEK